MEIIKLLPERVPVLLQEGPGVVEDDPGEVVQPEGCVDVRLNRK